MTKAKPPSRQELNELLVTNADAFTVFRYLRHRDNVPRLPELEENGQATIPGSEGVLADLYYSLWAPEPGLQEEGEISPDRRYWRKLLEKTLASAAFQKLHAQTQLKELQSVLGTIAMGEQVLALVPEEDREQLKKLAKAQQEADELDSEAQKVQAQAQAARQLAEAAAQHAGKGRGEASDGESDSQSQPGVASGQDQPQQSGGQPQGQPIGAAGGMTADEARERANELTQAAAQAQANAEVVQEQANEARAMAEEMAEALMGKSGSQAAAEKQRQLARQGIAAVKAAQVQVQEVSDTVQMWGLDPGELTRESFAEVQQILAAIKQNPALQQFQKLLGRLRRIAARKARSKDRAEGTPETRQELGRDLKRATRRELVALVHPALQVQARTRWAKRQLRLRGQKSRRKLGRGPVVVLEDASGSMNGAKQQWTKALVLALAHFAKLRKRSFGWVLFDTYVRVSRIYKKGALSAQNLLEIAESRAGGGTSFETPLRKALEMIRHEGLTKADIVLVTDGMCDVSDEFLRELTVVKQAFEINIFVVLVNVGDTTDKTVREFADRIIPISELTAEEAESKVIGVL